MKYEVFFRGESLLEVLSEDLHDIVATFICFIDHPSRTVIL